MNIKIYPLSGIGTDSIRIALGMTKDALIAELGLPETVYEKLPSAPDLTQLYYYNGELRFDFDVNDTLEFIEFLGGAEGSLQPEIYGVSAFAAIADDLIALLTDKGGGEIIDDENGYSYAFPAIGIGVYRESLPEDVEEMREEHEADGDPLSEEEYQDELSQAIHWATIGMGARGYYNS